MSIDLHPDLLDGFLWYLFDMIPALRVNDSIGWPKQMELEGGGKGWILLVFRTVTLLSVFRLATRLLDARADAQPPREAL